MNKDIRIVDAALQERKDGHIILRGALDMSTAGNLKVGSYQREYLGKRGLKRAVKENAILPDVELGMRGQHFSSSKGGTFILHDPTYIIDGLQRITTLKDHLENANGDASKIDNPGVTVHFDTTAESENDRFVILNGSNRTPVSPNVILRDVRDKHISVMTLYGLSKNDPQFALYDRVTWKQRALSSELLSASNLLQATRSLYQHIVPLVAKGPGLPQIKGREAGIRKAGGGGGGGDQYLLGLLDRVAGHIKVDVYRANIKTLFEIVDECFGVRSVAYPKDQPQLRRNFLMVLGSFFSRNPKFWDDHHLSVPSKVRKRLKQFPVRDPAISNMCSAGTMVLDDLYDKLRRHMNKGLADKNRFE